MVLIILPTYSTVFRYILLNWSLTCRKAGLCSEDAACQKTIPFGSAIPAMQKYSENIKMNEFIFIILAFVASPLLTSADCTFSDDAFGNIRYQCGDTRGFLREDSFGNVTDSRTKTTWRKDSFGNINSSEGTTWRTDSFGNFTSDKGGLWRKDSFGKWISNDGVSCRMDSFDNIRCR